MRERLKQLLKEKNISVAELSYGTHITCQAIYKFFAKPGTDMSLRNCIKIADFFGITLDDLVGRKVKK